MVDKIESTLRTILANDSFQMEQDGCAGFELPSGASLFVRWFEEDGNLLATIPLGTLNREQIELRSILMLIANHTGYQFGGGGIGVDPETYEVSLTRVFFVNTDQEDWQNSLCHLPEFCFAADMAAQWLTALNDLVYDPESDDVSMLNMNLDDVAKYQNELVADPEATQMPQWSDEALQLFREHAEQAFQELSVEPSQEPEDPAYYIANDDIVVQLNFDPILEEITMMALLRELSIEELTGNAANWCIANHYLTKTGNCVLGVTEEEPFYLSLSYGIPFESIQDDSIKLSNLLGAFWGNAAALRTELAPASGAESPTVPANPQMFV